MCSITFTLVVDDFGVKYVDKADVEHWIASIKTSSTFTKDWTGDYTAALISDGITKSIPLTSRCRDISKKKYRNMNISIQKSNSIVRTHPSPNSSTAKPNGLSQATIPNFLTNAAKNRFRKLLGTFCITPLQWTCRYWWHWVPLQCCKRSPPTIQGHVASSC
jgi:hypothetical protein